MSYHRFPTVTASHRPSTVLAVPAFAACLCLLVGCPNSPAWRIRFQTGGDRDATEFVRARVHEGLCDGPIIFETEIDRDVDGMSPPALASGQYGVEALAIDAECRVIARTCVIVTIPVDADLVLYLQSLARPVALCVASAGTDGRGGSARDAGRLDGSCLEEARSDAPDAAREVGMGAVDTGVVEIDAADRSPPTVRVTHLARDTGPVDVYADGTLLAGALTFSTVGTSVSISEGTVTFRVTRAGTEETLLSQTLTTELGRGYTLTVYGDEDSPPFPERTLALLLLDDDASGLDVTRDIRLAFVHVAGPVIAGQLVAVTPSGNVLLADDFGFRAVAPLTLPSMSYRVGFDAGADGVIDIEFDVPALVPGSYASVFLAARRDDSVFLLVNTARGATVEIDPN